MSGLASLSGLVRLLTSMVLWMPLEQYAAEKAYWQPGVFFKGLLSVGCKILRRLSVFLLGWWSEAALVVDKNDPGGLEKDQHIRLPVSIDINKLEGNRRLVGVGPKKLRPQVDARVRSVPAGEFDDFDLSVKIDCKVMAGIACGIAVPDNRVGLESTGIAKMEIIHRVVPPVNAGGQQRPQHQRGQHAQTEEQKRMRA